MIKTTEAYQLPAPDFRKTYNRTVSVIFGLRDLDKMDRSDRIRACYQHCCLKWVMGDRMTNQSLRERFNLSENKSAITSQIITATTDAKMIKLDEGVGSSRKFARYLPFWA